MSRFEQERIIIPTHEQFKVNVGERFWKAPVDIPAKHLQALKPGLNDVPVIVSPLALPPMRHLSSDALKHISASMRSRYAQLGLEPDENIGHNIAYFFDNYAELANDGTVEDSFEALIPIINHSPRTVIVEGNILRLYSEWASTPVRGEALIEKVHSGEIGLDGVEGEDWKWIYKKRNGRREEKDIVGVDVRIQPERRLWIPPDSENPIIRISSTSPDYRDEIKRLQRPIPETDEEVLWTGRVRISLGKSVEGIITEKIEGYVDPTEILEDEQEVCRSGRHIHSLLIDAGTNWGEGGVIVEIKSATSPLRIPKWVPFRFAQAA